MTEPVAEDVRRLLAEGVPPLPAPADRVGAVRRRVIRAAARRTVVAGVAASVLVVLAVAVPRLVADYAARPTPAASIGGDGCPVTGTAPEVFDSDERTGFRLPDGAIDVTLCELVVDPTTFPSYDPGAGTPRRLATDADAIVAALNAMPDRDAARGDIPEDQFGGCTAVGYPTALSFVLRYPDRAPIVVWLDWNCKGAVYNGQARFRIGGPLTDFFQRYRTQLAATADPVAPTCAQRLGPELVDPTMNLGQRQIRDGIGRNRYELEPFLPSPLAAVTVCRYAVSAAGGELLAARTIASASLATVENLVNVGLSDSIAGTECGMGVGPEPTTLFDRLLVVDETGTMSEVRLIRKPCTAIIVAARGALPPPPDLLALVDATLGPPPP